MDPAEAQRLVALALGTPSSAVTVSSLCRLWAGMGHVYSLTTDSKEEVIAKVVKLPKDCWSVGDVRKAKSYECEAAFYSGGFAARVADAGVEVPRALHAETRRDSVAIVMSRLTGRPGRFDRRQTVDAHVNGNGKEVVDVRDFYLPEILPVMKGCLF